MKTLADLQAIRDKARQQVELRKEKSGYRIVVGMATCGIAAGARPVMSALLAKAQKENLENVTITQTGCIGVCRLEPIVEVYNPDGEKVTYVQMTAEKADKIIAQHIQLGKPVTEFTIGYVEQANKAK